MSSEKEIARLEEFIRENPDAMVVLNGLDKAIPESHLLPEGGIGNYSGFPVMESSVLPEGVIVAVSPSKLCPRLMAPKRMPPTREPPWWWRVFHQNQLIRCE